jgi:hypothetical protein
MTETQKLYKELAELKAKTESVKKENTVECGAPTLKRTYSYRKQTIVSVNDLRL